MSNRRRRPWPRPGHTWREGLFEPVGLPIKGNDGGHHRQTYRRDFKVRRPGPSVRPQANQTRSGATSRATWVSTMAICRPGPSAPCQCRRRVSGVAVIGTMMRPRKVSEKSIVLVTLVACTGSRTDHDPAGCHGCDHGLERSPTTLERMRLAAEQDDGSQREHQRQT